MSDYAYQQPLEETAVSWTFLAMLAVPYIATWQPWDRNVNGEVTISDVWLLFGQAYTWVYATVYDLIPGPFYFFEIYRPSEPTYGSSVVGFVLWCGLTVLASGLIYILAASFEVARAGAKTRPDGP